MPRLPSGLLRGPLAAAWIAAGLLHGAAPAHANYRSVLDEPAPYAPAEVSMSGGRLTKLPVSFEQLVSVSATGMHSLQARVSCENGDDAALIVVARRTSTSAWLGTWFNADRSSSDKGADVFLPPMSIDATYSLYAFSQRRATAKCMIAYRTQPTGLFTVGPWLETGATLVEIGPMQSGDSLEVFSFGPAPDNAHEPNAGVTRATRLLAFALDPACTGSNGQLCTASQSLDSGSRPGDLDPGIVVGSGWESTRNFALVGKKATSSSDGPGGVETRVQLVHGPLDDDLDENVTQHSLLAPGRYAMWLNARTPTPAGDTQVVQNPSYALPGALPRNALPGSFGLCRGTEQLNDDGGPETFARGELNENLFTMTLWRQSASATGQAIGTPTPLRTRKVPLGALGADNDWSRFYLQFEVSAPAFYWLTADKFPGAMAAVEFAPRQGRVRNPDVSDFKVASWNMLYRDYEDSWSTTKYQNAANLLASRGIIDVANRRVIEDADQGRFEWDADVVSLQETVRENDVKAFRDEAMANSQPWEFSLGMAENATSAFSPFATRVATMVAESLWPTPADKTSIWFKQGALRPSGCTGAPGEGDWVGDQWIRCHLPGHNGHRWEYDLPGPLPTASGYSHTANYTIPAKAQVNKPAGVDRPVAVFSVHLNTGDADGEDERYYEVNALIEKMKAFRDLNPSSFYAAGLGSASEATRIIIVGDTNMYTHECGENYWFLRRLRAEFGYAVDVGMADEESASSSYGMHNYGASTVSVAPYGFVPALFQRIGQWVDGVDLTGAPVSEANQWTWDPDPAPGALETFPWWARTFRSRTLGDKGWGDRHDLVILVGKGWANDDPVASYAVMQDHVRTTPDGSCSPFAVSDGAHCLGVEMFHDGCTTGGFAIPRPGHAVPDGNGNYRPHRAMCPGFDQEGMPAVRTDHRPVGVRLRVFGGGANPR